MLHLLGTDIQQRLKDCDAPNENDQEVTDEYEQTKTQLRLLLKPQVRTIYERNIFHSMNMTDKDENVRDFVIRLRKQADRCSFSRTQRDEMIRDILIARCPHPTLQVHLLEAQKLTTEDAVKIWESYLQVRTQSQKLQERNVKEKDPSPETEQTGPQHENVNKIREKYRAPPKPFTERSQYNPPGSDISACFRCGRKGHNSYACTATKGQTCHKCGGKNHFARACRSSQTRRQQPSLGTRRRVNHLQESEEEDHEEELVFSTRPKKPINEKLKRGLTEISIENVKVKVLVDTGASVDIITRQDFKKLKGVKTPRTSRRLMPYGTQEALKLDGEFVAKTKAGGKEALSCWIIASHGDVSLLSGTTAELLGLVKRLDTANKLEEKSEAKLTLNKVLRDNQEVFRDELGQMADLTARLKLKEDAEPVFMKARPVPYALQDDVDKELKKWEDIGIAERIEYSDWASPLVVVPKAGGGVRLCGDYKHTVNKQLDVPQHPMPNLEDMLPKLAGKKYFSKLDLSTAYLQMRLDEESQKFTVLNTPRGLLKIKRLPYGISAAPATFQRAMEKILENMPGTVCFLDDVLVAGATEEEALCRLDQALKRLRSWKLVLKQTKCKFLMSCVQYLGVEVSAAGVQTVKEKVDPVLHAPPPRDTSELRSFLGAVTFYARFIPDMSSVAAPLNKLLQKREKWRWTATEERSFDELKRRLASAPVLAHYDGRRPVRLITDASPHGVGAVLMQVGEDGAERPVRFASRSLTKAEKAYSQFDREGLAVIFGVARYKQYLWGRKFTLVTDNKALASVFGPKSNTPALATARLHRWALILAAYSYDIEHRKAEEIPMADFLSRLPYDRPVETRNDRDEASVCFLEQMENL